jgi:hypothetical protein
MKLTNASLLNATAIFLVFAGLAKSATGCADPAADDAAPGVAGIATEARSAAAQPLPFSISGEREALVVGDAKGVLRIVTLGESSTVRAVEGETLPAAPRSGRTRDGVVFVLATDGTVAAVDPESAAVTRAVPTAIDYAFDLEIVDAHTAVITSAVDGVLRKVDLRTGETLAHLDLDEVAGASALGSLTVQDGVLYVQVQRTRGRNQSRGAVALVRPADLHVMKLVELEVEDPAAPGALLHGLQPSGAFVADGNYLYVTAKGDRPRNTGLLLRLDVARGALDPWVLRAQAGFQGPLALGPGGESFGVYHTSTPVASSHLFRTALAAAPPRLEGEALLDAFEEVTELPASRDRSVFALPISCPVGFCVGGAGITFVTTKDGVVHPRLSAEALGGKPEFVLFL